MKKKVIEGNLLKIGAVLCLLALWVTIPFVLNDKVAADESESDIRIQASLSGEAIGGVTPGGFSEYRLDDDGRRRLKLDASSINLPSGTVLNVALNNTVIRQITVNGFGGASFDIDSNNGQSVPSVSNGNTIDVRNGQTVILAGTFGIVVPTPSPSASPSASPGGSPSPTVSPSPGATPSPTVSPSPGATPSPSPGGTPNSGNLFAGLSGATINGVLPNGYAEYELHSSRLELEVRVNQVNLGSGTALTVSVNDTTAGIMFLESGGEGRLRLRSDRGDNIPVVTSGSSIRIISGGNTILSGTFSGFTGPTPSPSPSASPSPTVSPSPGGTPGPTPSPSPSPSPSFGRSFEANLTGTQLVPPVTTNATGEFKINLNETETQATIFGEFHNLSSAQTGARIESTVGSAQVIHNFGVIGGTNGNFSSVTIDVNAAQVQQLRTGLVRAVITSANNPNGEVASPFRQQSNRSDFDGDGSNDFAVFRPSTGTWFVQNEAGLSIQVYGTSSDKIVSSDFDGDGKTDWAFFRNVGGLGEWNIKRSSDGGTTVEQFGLGTDDPLRGDFDGDGRVDTAVFRQSNGVWYIKQSSNGAFRFVQFGATGDKALPADMDGDGKDDIVVFRQSVGNWYWINSSNGQVGAMHFGMAGDTPVAADFDGDGRNDITVFRASQGTWYSTLSSTGGFFGMHFGLDGDVPVAGDYDRDGRTDVAVYRRSTGHWYITRSSDTGFQVTAFGLNEDIPVIVH